MAAPGYPQARPLFMSSYFSGRPQILTVRERVDAELKNAMRAKDKVRVEALRSIISQLSYRRIEAGQELEPDAQIDVVRKLIKQRNDSISEFAKAGRTDLVDKETAERDILKEFGPPEADPEVVRAAVREVLAGMDPAGRTEGAAMKILMPKLKGQADGSVIKAILLEELQTGV